MEYDKIIDLDNITLEDCERFYDNNKSLIVNDGKIVDVLEEDYEV